MDVQTRTNQSVVDLVTHEDAATSRGFSVASLATLVRKLPAAGAGPRRKLADMRSLAALLVLYSVQHGVVPPGNELTHMDAAGHYVTDEPIEYDLYCPRGDGPWPLVGLVADGPRALAAPVAELLAAWGFLVVTIDLASDPPGTRPYSTADAL